MPVKEDYIGASSYDKDQSTGKVTIHLNLTMDISGQDIILVDDIFDTGNTLSAVVEEVRKQEPTSIAVTTLLDKPERRQVDVDVRYIGRKIPNEFVVGNGLDYEEDFRNLPFIGVLEGPIMENQPDPLNGRTEVR